MAENWLTVKHPHNPHFSITVSKSDTGNIVLSQNDDIIVVNKSMVKKLMETIKNV